MGSGALAAASQEDLAWLAGLFEGEGSIHTTTPNLKKPRLQPQLHLGMTDEDIIRRVHALTGFGSVRARDNSHRGRKTLWVWYSGRYEHVQGFIAAIWKWLGIRRRAQATKAFRATKESWDEYPTRPRRAGGWRPGHTLAMNRRDEMKGMVV